MAKKEKPEKQKEKSVLEIAREMEAQQRQQAEKLLAEKRLKEEQERQNYEEQLKEEKKELLKLKQGVIDSSETIHEEQEQQKKYTFGEKVANFVYLNQWWLWIAGIFLVLVGILVWQIVTTVKPDMIILLVSDNDYFSAACSEGIEELFERYIDDENGDGKISVDVYYMPASASRSENDNYTGDQTKLFAEFQLGEAVLIISDADADELIVPENNLDNLEKAFGNYRETQGVRFFLKDTNFAEYLEWDEPFDEDIYIGIRKVKKTLDSEEEMQEVYDISFPALEKFVEEFGHLEN